MMSHLTEKQLSDAAVATREFSAGLSLITMAETSRVDLRADAGGRLNFGLAVRPVPIRAELPSAGWCNVGRVMFTPPKFSMQMVVPAGVYQTMRLCYSAEMLEETGLNDADLEHLPPASVDLKSQFIGMDLYRLARELQAPRFGHAAFVESAGRVILGEVARLLSQRVAEPALASGGLSQWRKRIILERLNSECARAPRIAELAELCDLSSRHLMRAFAHEMGETLGDMIRRVSIERAKARLLKDDAPIGEIGRDLGFSTSASFAVAFKREVGLLPSEYRRQRVRHR